MSRRKKKVEPISLEVEESEFPYDHLSGAFPTPTRKLPVFNMKKLFKPDYTVVFYGKRRTGKSFCLRWLLAEHAHEYPLLLVFTTTKLNGYWQQYINDRYIHPGFKPSVIAKFFERQKFMKVSPRYAKTNRKAFIILDDVISDKALWHSSEVVELFVAGRHYDCGVAITTQATKGIHPKLRNNTDIAFVFYMESEAEKKNIFLSYFDFMDYKKEFIPLFTKYTANNGCLVRVTTGFEGRPWEGVFQFKAEDPGEFRLGSREMWRENNLSM